MNQARTPTDNLVSLATLIQDMNLRKTTLESALAVFVLRSCNGDLGQAFKTLENIQKQEK